MEQLHVGLVGLGLMGSGMGQSLLRAGHRLSIVAHRRRETALMLCERGATEVREPAVLARDCDAVVLCLPSVESTESVLFGSQGLARAGQKQLTVIECSTLLPEAGRSFAARLEAVGLGFVDAPVTRGPTEAAQGCLNALVGGDAGHLAAAQPVLKAFCEQIFHFGPPGAGYAAKLVNNFLAFSQLAAVAEAMATAVRAGLDLGTLLAAIQVSGGQSRVLDGLTPWLSSSGPPRSRVTLETAHKDVSYYSQFAQSMGTAGPVADEVKARMDSALNQGLGSQFTPAYLHLVAGAVGAALPAAPRD